MKIKIHPQSSAQGGVMTITLLTALIIGFALASYLSLVSSQNVSTMRSLAWNSAVPILEAGVEEALTHLKYRGITNLSTDNWTYTTTQYGAGYFKKRSLGSSYCEVFILPSNPPQIFSAGYVPAPLAPSSTLGMILGAVSYGDGQEGSANFMIRRRIRVDTKKEALFAKAMVAEGQINLMGNNITTDSFNSMNPATGGKLPDPVTKPNEVHDQGDVATNSELINSLSMGNADIMGHISTGPGGTISIGPQGVAGSKPWVQSGTHNGQIEPTWSEDDMNVDFPPVAIPSTTSSVSYGNVNVSGTNYNFVLNTGSYQVIGSGGLKGNVLVKGNAVLYVPSGSSLSFSGSDKIVIAPGATLKLFVGCTTASWSGQASIVNQNISNPATHDVGAVHFQYYGLPTNTQLDMTGNASFTGVIYAPNANLKLGGGGNDNYDLVGSTVTKTVTMNGHMNFHYDEALKDWGPDLGYVVTAWNEI
jgi:hypothetical protein